MHAKNNCFFNAQVKSILIIRSWRTKSSFCQSFGKRSLILILTATQSIQNEVRISIYPFSWRRHVCNWTKNSVWQLQALPFHSNGRTRVKIAFSTSRFQPWCKLISYSSNTISNNIYASCFTSFSILIFFIYFFITYNRLSFGKNRVMLASLLTLCFHLICKEIHFSFWRRGCPHKLWLIMYKGKLF